ncbi:MAG TPA: hypothetical protein PKI81_01505, partial [bacterium]|nr:hypothetical protein [bacterium]
MAKPSAGRDLGAEVTALFAREPQKSYTARELARQVGVGKEEYVELRKTLRRLVQEGTILKLRSNRFGSASQSPVVTGILRVNSQGYGFVTRDDGRDDIFVSSKQMGSALHKDRVRVRLYANRQGERPEGQVIEIVERGRDRIVGTFRWGRKYSYVVPDDIKIQTDIIIPEPEESGV